MCCHPGIYRHTISSTIKEGTHEKNVLALLSAAILTLQAASLPASAFYGNSLAELVQPSNYDQPVDTDLWEKFLKYDLCITDYAAMSESQQALCRFIFETEQSAKDTILCARARAILMECSPVECFSADDIDAALTDISSLYDLNGRIYSLIYPNSRNRLFADVQHIDGDMCVDEYWLDAAGMQRILVRYPAPYSGNPENLCAFDLCSYEEKTSQWTCEALDPPDDAQPQMLSFDGAKYKLLADGTAELIRTDVVCDSFSVPDTVEGYAVTGIGARAFQNSGLREIRLPKGLRYIDTYAFGGCKNLTKLDFPSDLEYIGVGAFAMSGLRQLKISCPNAVIDKRAFLAVGVANCTLNVKYIGAEAFSYCDGLEQVSLGGNLQEIGAKAFFRCASLTGISFPDSLQVIGQDAFLHTGLKAVALPDSVAALGRFSLDRGKICGSDLDLPAVDPLTADAVHVFDDACILYADPDTEAQRYAEEHTYPFTELTTLPGDVNSDGALTVADILRMQRYLVSRDLTLINRQMADWNQDGVINAADLALLKRTLMR